MTTQRANATYQEIIDLHTEENTVSVIGIHTPCNQIPQRMLSGFWKQFQKFRYNGCSFSMVPAARLPTDPLHVDVDPGSSSSIMDPRDNLNPILFHGCHGNDLGQILNQFYESGNVAGDFQDSFTIDADNRMDGAKGSVKLNSGDSADIQVIQSPSIEQNIMSTTRVGDVYLDTLYYRALTDTTWRKSGPQSGLKIRGLHPLVYNVATTRSLGTSGNENNTVPINTGYGPYRGASRTHTSGKSNLPAGSDSAGTHSLYSESAGEEQLGSNMVQGPQYRVATGDTSDPIALRYRPVRDTPLYTPSTRRLGWMDTRLRDENGNRSVSGFNGNFSHDSQLISGNFIAEKENFATVPKIFMGMLLLPRAYRTEQYFRCILTHSFSFAGFRGQSMTTDYVGDVNSAPGYWNFN